MELVNPIPVPFLYLGSTFLVLFTTLCQEIALLVLMLYKVLLGNFPVFTLKDLVTLLPFLLCTLWLFTFNHLVVLVHSQMAPKYFGGISWTKFVLV